MICFGVKGESFSCSKLPLVIVHVLWQVAYPTASGLGYNLVISCMFVEGEDVMMMQAVSQRLKMMLM